MWNLCNQNVTILIWTVTWVYGANTRSTKRKKQRQPLSQFKCCAEPNEWLETVMEDVEANDTEMQKSETYKELKVAFGVPKVWTVE